MDDEKNIQTVELIRESIGVQFMVDEHAFSTSNMEIKSRLDDMAVASVYSMTQWFLTRKLKDDYVFRHPKNLWHLFLYFCFGRWTWFKYRFIEFTEHKVTVKEAYGNIAFPDKKPVVIVRKFENNLDIHDDDQT